MTPHPLLIKSLNALQKGQFAEARQYIRSLTETAPREAQHELIEGLSSLALADWPAAREVFSRATETHPNNAQFWFNRALAEENLNLLTEAEASYQRSLSLKPDQGEAFGNLSNIYRRLGRLPEAVQMACRAMATDVPKAHALNVLGLALGKSGNFSEARKAFDEAIALAPQESSFFANRANLAVDELDFTSAWPDFEKARAIADAPIFRRDEGMARLLAGDYENGLPLYEARLDMPETLRVKPSMPRWQGEDLNGRRLLIVSEQGFGDGIQFCAYADALAQQGAALLWLVRSPLKRLMQANVSGSVHDQTHGVPDADFWLPMLSLPYALNVHGPVPAPRRLKAPAEPRLPVRNGKSKIGLIWRGSATHANDALRSISFEKLAPLWQNIDAQFFAAFKGAAAEKELAATPVKPLDEMMGDFADAASLISQMDCVISVDTAAAHLAAALGITTYLLLPYCPDWRWGTAGETTGWYESMRILRQPRHGDWDSVMQQLLKKLA